MNILQTKAVSHIQSIVSDIFEHQSGQSSLIIYDNRTGLSQLLANTYHTVLPKSVSINFDESNKQNILNAINLLPKKSLVVLVQSTSFRLDDFRIRLYLFERGLKVIEHPHLGRIASCEYEIYINALAYDAAYYHTLGPALKNRLDCAKEVRLISGGKSLVYEGPLEPAKLNIGDYRDLKNWGGQFPIGEVFTELRDLTLLNGTIFLFAFGDQQFSVCDCPDPILLDVKAGRVENITNAPQSFLNIIDDICRHEGTCWVRELGFGLNPAMTRTMRTSGDVGTFERMCGVHLSLGGKHALYPKTGFHKKKVKYHVDVFPVVDQVIVDEKIIFENGAYLV